MTRFLFIALIAISFTAPALAQSMLRVKLAGSTPITLSVDGRYFNRRGTSVTVGDLPPGMHLVKIYAETDYQWGRRYQETIYKGRVRTDAGLLTELIYDHYHGGTNVQQFEMSKDKFAYRGNNTSDALPPNNNYRDNNIVEQPVPDTRTTQDQTTGAEPGTRATTRNENKPAASPVTIDEGTMTDTKTGKLKAKVNGKNTDTEKLTAMKDGLQNEKITTYQVSEMMDWFSFESSKLDFAKWAYDITTDKENFGSLVAKFSYKNSEDELRKFLQTK